MINGVRKAFITIVAAGMLLLVGRDVRALEIPVGSNDADFVAAGMHATNAAQLGAVYGIHRSGETFHGSATFLTDLTGNRYDIGSPPAIAETLTIGGFGNHGTSGNISTVQDGLPRVGIGPSAVPSGGYNTTYYAGEFFNPGTYGPMNVSAAGFDSGGMIRYGDSVVGVISTRAGNRINYARLDTIEDWIIENTAGGGIWAVTAAHLSIDAADPIALVHVDLGNFYSPTMQFDVVQVIDYPTYAGSAGVIDNQNPDITLLKLVPVPEPAGLMFFALAAGLCGRRRRVG